MGPIAVGLGVWCAAGEVSLGTPDSLSPRLAVPGDWWIFAIAAIAGGLVPAWRRQPLTAAPALVATLPWWPMPLPAIALLWAGPLAWLPILLAGVAAIVWTTRARPVTSRVRAYSSPIGASIVAGASTALAVLLVAWALAVRLPGGDEVHYLVIAQSLLSDGDLKIENNHQRRDYAAYYPVDIRPDFLRRGQDGAIYSIHAPGTSLVVLPAFALFGYLGAQATFLLLSAFAGACVWWAAWLWARDRPSAWIGWIAVVATPTYLIQSVTIFPDGVGAFVVAASVVLLMRLWTPAVRPSHADLIGLSALLSTLPWLHTRFAVLAAGLAALGYWRLAHDDSAGSGRADRFKRAAAFSLLPVVSAVAWVAYFQVLYGTFDPRAPYGDEPHTSMAYAPGGLMGLLLDGQFGLLTYSPILAAAFAGPFLTPRSRERRLATALLGVALAYLGATACYWMWWAGVPASPARFATAALPLFAMPVALAWKWALPALRALWLALATISIATSIALLGTNGGRLAWNTRGIRSAWLDWLNGVVDLSRGVPFFFWQLNPDDVRSQAHFALHVFIWLALLVLCSVAVLYLRRAASARRELDGAVVGWAVLAALMAAVQAGWWLNGSVLNPAASQLAVLNRAQSGERVFELGHAGFGWRQVPTTSLPVVALHATRADDVGEGSVGWLPLLDVPAGYYRVVLSSHRPRAGALALRVGRSAMPLRVLTLDATSTHALAMSLPAGASALFMEPSGDFATVGGTIRLVPVSLARGRHAHATASARYGAIDVFFFGPTVFPEPDGFWTRGAQTVSFTIGAADTRPSVTLEIENGGVENEISVMSSAAIERRRMTPGERQVVTVPVVQGQADVELRSGSGFRWSDVRGGEDRRYLGVRVRILE